MFEHVSVSSGANSLAQDVDRVMASLSHAAHSVWAKTCEDGGSFLSLPQHLFDTACVAACLWDGWVSQQLKQTLSFDMEVSEDEIRTLFVWLAGVHDIGKCSRAFEDQIRFRDGAEELLMQLFDQGLDSTVDEFEAQAWFPHALASRILVESWLATQGVPRNIALKLAAIVDSHHGLPSRADARSRAAAILDGYPDSWKAVQSELLDTVAQWSGVQSVLESIRELHSSSALLLTGLLIQADWIASNQNGFPVVAVDSQLDRLTRGMSAARLTGSWQPKKYTEGPASAFKEAFGWPKAFNSRPVQEAAFNAAVSWSEPGLMIIEAPTGEGKTEAGLMAAQVIGHRTGAQGVAVAAPTMATANGLFNRFLSWAENSGQNSDPQSLYLAHSKNRLSTEYEKLLFKDIGLDSDDHGTVEAGHWYQTPKKGLLSNFVVGTVDQLLMMVLQMKHSMLRHISLAGKVVIIDEVHSYDAYMSQYLQMLLVWFAQYRVPVILMSATLPLEKKQELVTGYGEICGVSPKLSSNAYPLITMVGDGGVEEIAVTPNPEQVSIDVGLIGDGLDETIRLLRSKLADGGCALVICNTIARAQEAFAEIEHVFPNAVELHHSGFIASERVEKEKALLAELGPDAHRGQGRPYLKIVVATQVAEQSLDIDADLLITDIAPIDLIIQRAGRIQRHDRPEDDRPQAVKDAAVYIRGVMDYGSEPKFDPGTAAIYDEKILIATLAHLKERGFDRVFNRPADIASWVQDVYSRESVEPAWQAAWEKACDRSVSLQEQKIASARGYRFPAPVQSDYLDPYFAQILSDREKSNSASRLETVALAQVRDAPFSFEVIVIRQSDYGYGLWDGNDELTYADSDELNWDTARELAASSIRLPAKVGRGNKDYEEVIDELERQTPESWLKHPLLKGQVALRFDESGNARAGRWKFHYSTRTGLHTGLAE